MSFTNPATRGFSRVETRDYVHPMTIQGTFNKLGILLICMSSAAAIGWYTFFFAPAVSNMLLLPSFIGGLVLGFLTVFRPHRARYTAIAYALCQGMCMGTISAFTEIRYPGISATVVALTTATATGMLLLYRFEIIKVTDTFKALVFSATLGLACTYFIGFLLNLVGIIPTSFYESTSLGSIGFSIFAVAIAASNLLLNFALIEESVEESLPQYMEWYGAFTVLVTLIWLYFELLRLARKLAKRQDA